MTKLNIHAQSIQNPFANISSRIYFSYWLLEKGKKGKKKNPRRKWKERGGRGRWVVAVGGSGRPLYSFQS